MTSPLRVRYWITGSVVPKTSQAVPEILRAPLLTEANVYQFLLKGHAPQSEPFRKWVTEEVLPTIRKTGSYSAEDSLKSRVCWSKRL